MSNTSSGKSKYFSVATFLANFVQENANEKENYLKEREIKGYYDRKQELTISNLNDLPQITHH